VIPTWQPAFYEFLGASFISPDWVSCADRWCIVGSGDGVLVFNLNGLDQVGTIPLNVASPAAALTALGISAATVTALLKP
jgi:hypothetical protein